MLEKGDQYTREFIKKSLYIRSNATFDDLVTFSRESAVRGSGDVFKGTSKSGYAPYELSNFDVPRFNDESLEGHDFIKSIECTFKSYVLSRYLTGSAYCEANLK